MKRKLMIAAIAALAGLLPAYAAPALVFSGYIDYPARRDYRIEVSTYPSGLISRVATYSGSPQSLHEEMTVSQDARGITGADRFQRNLKSLEFVVEGDTIRYAIENENLDTGKKARSESAIKLRPAKDVLFVDEAREVSLRSDGILRIASKGGEAGEVIVRGNQILDDGWYRSDWKRVGDRTIVQEFTTMEIPGDWMSDGGGFFTGRSLYTGDPVIDAVNFYIVDAYLRRHIFLPFLFGLKTGSS
jgi:hypothetical protein